MASILLPAFFKAFGMAREGAVVNHNGSVAASEKPSIFPMIGKFKDKAVSLSAKIMADAPSLMLDALAAVTVPSGKKQVLILVFYRS